MTRGWPPAGGVPSTKARLGEPDAAAGGDFVWPPPADDPAACSILLLGADAGHAPRPRTTMLADEPAEAFPDIDIEAALDEFADSPAAPKVVPTARPAQPRTPSGAQPRVSRWRAAALRSVVALCIGASLALMPPPGLTRVLDARPVAVPANAEPPAATARRIGAPDRVRVAARAVSTPKPRKVVRRDEDQIRTTLAELQAAYSQLDAGAAREVWPSVDVDALARAFDGLRSQELRFDRCDVTVNGGRARAACTGEALYVPRAGDPDASSAARAWTFELRRIRERWKIASARAS
jgi:hypothetical protein